MMLGSNYKSKSVKNIKSQKYELVEIGVSPVIPKR